MAFTHVKHTHGPLDYTDYTNRKYFNNAKTSSYSQSFQYPNDMPDSRSSVGTLSPRRVSSPISQTGEVDKLLFGDGGLFDTNHEEVDIIQLDDESVANKSPLQTDSRIHQGHSPDGSTSPTNSLENMRRAGQLLYARPTSYIPLVSPQPLPISQPQLQLQLQFQPPHHQFQRRVQYVPYSEHSPTDHDSSNLHAQNFDHNGEPICSRHEAPQQPRQPTCYATKPMSVTEPISTREGLNAVYLDPFVAEEAQRMRAQIKIDHPNWY
jgi:hypothetical protein